MYPPTAVPALLSHGAAALLLPFPQFSLSWFVLSLLHDCNVCTSEKGKQLPMWRQPGRGRWSRCIL